MALCFSTSRLCAVSEMVLVDSCLRENPIVNLGVDLLKLKPTTGQESAFQFFIKSSSLLVCHIGFTHKRDCFEATYGTEENYRNKGYMTEALSATTRWIFANTNEQKIFALISNNAASERVLTKCGFSRCETHYNGLSTWYVLRKEEIIL